MKTEKFKIIISLFLIVILALSALTGCKTVNGIYDNLSEDGKMCKEYDLDKYTNYYWDTDVIYNEAVLPLQNEDGTMSPISLMYEIGKVLEVRSSDLETLYVEGKDYEVQDGKLVIPEGSSIKTTPYSGYYLTQKSTQEKIEGIEEGTFVLWGVSLHTLQIAVSYIHTDKWKGSVPPAQGKTLEKTLAKLENKEPVKILIYGDSISEGCDSSGHSGQKPFAPTWIEMLQAKLKQIYGYDEIEIINTALGGTDSSWGVQNAAKNGEDYAPDLAIVSFGMNDSYTDPATLAENILQICTTISFGNENCEFIVTATMLPNPNAKGFCGNQYLFAEALKNTDFSFAGTTVVADMSTLYSDILSTKRYIDVSNNNINHPNDFMARAYAMLMLRTLEKE